MNGLSTQVWDEPVVLEGPRFGPLADVRLGPTRLFTKLIPRTVRSQKVLTEHLVRALYGMLSSMSERQPGFFEVWCHIKVNGRWGGSIFWFDSTPTEPNLTLPENSTIIEVPTNSSTIEAGLSSASNENVTLLSTTINDPEFGNLKLSYTYNDKHVPAQEIFSAVFDGLAQLAQRHIYSQFNYMTAVSFSGNTAIHINSVSGTKVVSGNIARLLYLIIALVYASERVFRELEFSLLELNQKTATGFIMRVSRGTASLSTA